MVAYVLHEAKRIIGPKIRDEILEDAISLGGMGFSPILGCVYRILDSAWTQRADGVSLRPDEGSVQTDSRRTGFALQVESKAGSRNPDPTATD